MFKLRFGPPLPRRLQAERMDAPDLPAREHQVALTSLARINWFSRSAAIVAPSVFAVAKVRATPLRVLDLACGGGDVLIALARQAMRRGLKLEWIGCDRSETAVRHAQDQAERAGVAVRFLSCNVLRDELPADCDVVMTSLFLHHLDDEEAVELLRRMRDAARELVLVNDLIRSRRGYWLAQLACNVLTRSPIVRFDGPVSVAGAYTTEEVRRLAERAGMNGASLRRCWPQRYLLEWRRPC